jgi:7-carboxy-7-deazaguanine synthase
MADKNYRINEVFYSVQGEGMRAGTANVFVRFSGCNLRCRVEPGELSPGGFDCDTEFASGRSLTANELLDWVRKVGGPCRWIIFTGGEPGLQLDLELVNLFRENQYQMAVETNGSIDLSPLGLDWVCVSPKVAEHAVRQLKANEVKYVRAHGQAIPKPACTADHQLISPAFNGLTVDRDSLKWCIRLVEENPEWRLSVQLHKSWLVR